MRTDKTSFLGVIGLAVMLVALQIGCQKAEEPATTSSSQTTAGSPSQPARSRPAGQAVAQAHQHLLSHALSLWPLAPR